MPDPAGRMSQSLRFKTSIQTKRNIKKIRNADNLLNFSFTSFCGRTVFFRKVEKSYWSVKTLWLSLLAECMSLYRETKKKVLGAIVARSIGYRWPSPPFFDGGSLPFLLFSLPYEFFTLCPRLPADAWHILPFTSANAIRTAIFKP